MNHYEQLMELEKRCHETFNKIDSGRILDLISKENLEEEKEEFENLPEVYWYDKYNLCEVYKVTAVSKNDNNEIIIWGKDYSGESNTPVRQFKQVELEAIDLVTVADMVEARL